MNIRLLREHIRKILRRRGNLVHKKRVRHRRDTKRHVVACATSNVLDKSLN